MVLWVMYAKMYAMMMGMSMNWGLRLPSLYTLQSMNIDMATNIGKKTIGQDLYHYYYYVSFSRSI